jgi:hypothetical protein
MKWKLIRDPITGQENVVWRKHENGTEESCLITAKEYLAWLAEGNEPIPADQPE